MERCKTLAAIAADRGESPVGSVVVLGDDIIGEGIEAGKSRQDVTFHAEVEAVREAVRKHGKDLPQLRFTPRTNPVFCAATSSGPIESVEWSFKRR